MIEVISESRCTSCNICVAVCPMNVFQSVKDAAPVIARQDECQTCFLCEAHCPDDALYVAPQSDEVLGLTDEAVEQANLFGSYRRAIGWTPGYAENRSSDETYRLLKMH